MNKLTLFLLLFLQVFFSKADLAHEVINKYHNRIIIFTNAGWYGNFALSVQAGFSEIHIIDEDEVLIEHCKIILPNWLKENKMHVATNYYLGNSETNLKSILDHIKEPVTFFLNNNRSNPEQQKEQKLVEELKQIKNHPIKKHTILIDYINYSMPLDPLHSDLIKQYLLEINPNYIFKFERGGHIGKEENAILVAYLS